MATPATEEDDETDDGPRAKSAADVTRCWLAPNRLRCAPTGDSVDWWAPLVAAVVDVRCVGCGVLAPPPAPLEMPPVANNAGARRSSVRGTSGPSHWKT